MDRTQPAAPSEPAESTDFTFAPRPDARQARRPMTNPFRKLHPKRPLNWYDYAELWMPQKLGRILDYGCGTGELFARLGARCEEYWGVDVDEKKLAEVARKFPSTITTAVPSGSALPFPDGFFDHILVLEVIEHVSDERRVLDELARVLAVGGRLLLTTPHRGLLTFLDPGNFKFLAPRVHRWVHCNLLGQNRYYDQRFGEDRRREKGMIADFTTDQVPWHRHYRFGQIRELAPRSLVTLDWTVYYPGFRALWSLRLALRVATFGYLQTLPFPLSVVDRRLSRVQSRWGDQLVVLFEKVAGGESSFDLNDRAG